MARADEPAARGGNEQGVEALVEGLRADPRWRAGCEAWHELPAREARPCAFPAGLHPRLVELARARGLSRLWSHQAEAVEAALAGRDVLVSTPTASGKTLCYTLPVLDALLRSEGSARSLWMFPTKALSQDQSANLSALVRELGEDWHAFTYDGDTPPSVRRTLRDRGHLVLTNPWMLHAGILPNHAKWSELFRDLRYVVIDELHTLSGVFGSSVANVLRRLVRIARHYGSDPRFLCSSATLREPAAHARRLLGRDVHVVARDGSPSGRRYLAVYNPPLLDPVAGLRASALEEARRLAPRLVGPGHQTIVFCGRRTSVEVLTRYLKEGAHELGLRPEEVRGYRGGYLPDLRREIEDGLRRGEVKVVVSTNALELGIDVGALDVCVIVGYPGSQASFWQRAGRVGRRGRASLVVQIARADPVDQFLARHPERLLGEPQERLGLDPDNLVILSEHLKCAAFELPFARSRAPEDAGGVADPAFGAVAGASEVLDYLAEEAGLLLARDERWYWMADAYPAQDVVLAREEPDNVLVLDADTKQAIGEIDRAGSITTVYEGAIYQVEGETWKVERFDHKNRRAYVRRVESDYFTEAQADTEVRVLREDQRLLRVREGCSPPREPDQREPERAPDAPGHARRWSEERADAVEDASVRRVEVHVTTLATQYKKIRFYTRENVGAEDIHLPPEEIDSEALVLTLSDLSAEALGLNGGDRGAAWRGLGVLLRRVAPLVVRCQPNDLGLSTQVRSPHYARPALFLFDRVRGGVGLAEVLVREHRALLGAAREVVERCACQHGCPACVGPLEEVGPEGKALAARLLAHLVEGGAFVALESERAALESVA